ncbi:MULTISPECIES: retropepsin-like aspartic protease [Tepidibacillus]|uniref:Aspartyl protease n=1 Tax=Tepidibacillus decaturensis TaxID=1413211 RepID=A0A135L6K1_9BACI|nr:MULTISPECIES: retropepsin-like aspartic protease [Tepidibacillus]KXG44618.1 aspartyl protease [Tepidibacillus decaturensis]GBF11854.1 hypothetical protein HK1_01893 [Tepidibacillus sp. HK-1]
MKIKYQYGLLLVDIRITTNGKSKTIKNLVVDTGASKTLISQNAVDDIGVQVEVNDRIVTYYGIGGKEHAFRKKVDEITIGDFSIKNLDIDFNDFGYKDINGLLGLDVLMEAGFKIDLLNLKLEKSSESTNE